MKQLLFWAMGLTVGASVVGSPVLAGRKAPVAKTPAASAKKVSVTVQQILDRHLAAIGGAESYKKLTSTVMTGTISIPANGINGTFVAKAKAPNQFLLVQTIQGIGDTKSGYDGKKGWMSSALTGVRELTGPELSNLERSSDFYNEMNWKKHFKSWSVVGIRRVDGKEAYAVKFVPATGKPEVRYYDRLNYHLLRTDMVVDGPQGTVPTESYFSDYRDVDGVKQPFVTRQKLAGLEVVTKVSSIKTNVPIDDAEFNKPAATAPLPKRQ